VGAVVRGSLRRQEARAPERHHASPEQDPVQEAAARQIELPKRQKAHGYREPDYPYKFIRRSSEFTDRPGSTNGGVLPMAHSYPADLAEVVLRAWHDGSSLTDEYCEAVHDHDALPAPDCPRDHPLHLLPGEPPPGGGAPGRFRLIVANAASFPAPGGPPHGLHRLLFDEPRPFSHHELRRLAPAVDFHRALIGAQIEPRDGLMLWGMITTGPRWVQAMYGGRQRFQRLPANLVVRVTAPGRVAVCKGLVTLATLVGGRIVQPSLDIFDSTWLPATFAGWRDELLALHREARERASTPWAELDPGLTRLIVQHSVRSVIGLMRNSHHGGTILFLPPEGDGSIEKLGGRVRPKYGFRIRRAAPTIPHAHRRADQRARRRAADAPGAAQGRLGGVREQHRRRRRADRRGHLRAGAPGRGAGGGRRRRRSQQAIRAARVRRRDRRRSAAVRWVARALDAEGTAKVRESVESDGTRHRSAYRLCNFVHDALAIVVSQDGTVRFVKWHEGEVTYWDHVSDERARRVSGAPRISQTREPPRRRGEPDPPVAPSRMRPGRGEPLAGGPSRPVA
jgi:hypothetical protein